MRLQDKIRKEGTVLRRERIIMSGDTEPTLVRADRPRWLEPDQPGSRLMQTMIASSRRSSSSTCSRGMWVTLKYTPQPAFTFQYPAERRPTAPRFRGVLRLQVEPGTGAQTCIVCDQCAKACPDDLIALGGHREPGQKIKVLDYFDFNLSRCSFCGLCAEVCPTKPIKALIMSEDYELGTYSRDAQMLRVDQMYDGVPIEHVHPLNFESGCLSRLVASTTSGRPEPGVSGGLVLETRAGSVILSTVSVRGGFMIARGFRLVAVAAVVAAASFVIHADVTPQSQSAEIQLQLGERVPRRGALRGRARRVPARAGDRAARPGAAAARRASSPPRFASPNSTWRARRPRSWSPARRRRQTPSRSTPTRSGPPACSRKPRPRYKDALAPAARPGARRITAWRGPSPRRASWIWRWRRRRRRCGCPRAISKSTTPWARSTSGCTSTRRRPGRTATT